jgi:cyclic-di-GMP phosphodiesterase TipF (flagellum assembly factor)
MKAQAKIRQHQTKPLRLRFKKKSYWMGSLLLAAALCATFLAIMSAQVGLIAFGVLIVVCAGYYEVIQRRFWEHAQDFKLRQIREKHDGLVREVTRNQGDIAALKTGILKTAEKIERQEQALRETRNRFVPREDMKGIVENLRDTAARPRSSGFSNDVLNLESMPRALKNTALPDLEAADTAPIADNDIHADIHDAWPKKRTPPIVSRAANDGGRDDVPEYSDMVVRELVHHAIRNQSVEVFLQPIVRLPQRKTRFYEMFARIRAKPGLYLPAHKYMSVATGDALMHDIDSLLLTECLQIIQKTAHVERATPFFLNITTETLTNGAFMRRLLAFLAKNRHLSQRLVFEIRQSDFEGMSPGALEILRGLGRLGCALSIDHVESLNFDLKFLQTLKVRFIKIEALGFMKKARHDTGYRDLLNMKRKMEGNGIGVIIEKVESEFVLKELLDFDITYGQGHLFGKPDLQGAYRQRNVA